MLNKALPIKGVIGNPGQAKRTTVDAVFDGGKVTVREDLRALLQAQVAGSP